MSSGAKTLPLLIEWSPKKVRVFEPVSRRMTVGETLAAALAGEHRGRDAIFGISRRSAFVRSLYIPRLSKAEAEKAIGLQLHNVLPLQSTEYVFGFRLGAFDPTRGQIASVGAVKIDSLRKLHNDASLSGLKVRAVTPVAFGSWLAAREKGIRDCVVVEQDGDTLDLDVIHEGEVVYSRSAPLPESPEELQDEVSRTLKMSELPPLPIFSTGCPGIHVDLTYEKEAVQYLGAPGAFEKLLFSLELPEQAAQHELREERARMQRAVVAAAAAVGLTLYAVTSRSAPPAAAASVSASERAQIRAVQTETSRIRKEIADAQKANRILDVAFNPGQTFSDVIRELASASTANSWFTNLTLSRGAPLSVSGLAMTDADVAKFAASISRNPRFQEMKVISSSKATIGKKQVTQFMVLGKTKGILAYDRPPLERKKA